jgi:hypothetical protein
VHIATGEAITYEHFKLRSTGSDIVEVEFQALFGATGESVDGAQQDKAQEHQFLYIILLVRYHRSSFVLPRLRAGLASGRGYWKTAVTDVLAVTTITQTLEFDPGQVVGLPQFEKFVLGSAVRVTAVPVGNGAPQVTAGQLIPAGELVTVLPVLVVCSGTTLKIGAALPPGQYEMSGLLTVTVA